MNKIPLILRLGLIRALLRGEFVSISYGNDAYGHGRSVYRFELTERPSGWEKRRQRLAAKEAEREAAEAAARAEQEAMDPESAMRHLAMYAGMTIDPSASIFDLYDIEERRRIAQRAIHHLDRSGNTEGIRRATSLMDGLVSEGLL